MDSSLEKKLTGFRQIAQEKLQNIFFSIPGSFQLHEYSSTSRLAQSINIQFQ